MEPPPHWRCHLECGEGSVYEPIIFKDSKMSFINLHHLRNLQCGGGSYMQMTSLPQWTHGKPSLQVFIQKLNYHHPNKSTQYSRCGLTICATPGICKKKPHKLLNENVLLTGRGDVLWLQLASPSLYATPNQRNKMPGSRAVVWYMHICVHHIVFKLCMTAKERKKKLNKIELFVPCFLTLEK